MIKTKDKFGFFEAVNCMSRFGLHKNKSLRNCDTSRLRSSDMYYELRAGCCALLSASETKREIKEFLVKVLLCKWDKSLSSTRVNTSDMTSQLHTHSFFVTTIKTLLIYDEKNIFRDLLTSTVFSQRFMAHWIRNREVIKMETVTLSLGS